jgi:hypothetical protein
MTRKGKYWVTLDTMNRGALLNAFKGSRLNAY